MHNSNHVLKAGVAGIALLLAAAFLCPGLELSIAPDPVSPVLTWANVRGQAYRIESASHPASAWEPRIVRTGDHAALTWMDEEPASSRVYRVLTTANPAPFATLQQAVELTRRNQGIVGAVAAAIVPGVGLWVGTSGYAHGSSPVQPYTRFEVGSVTKTLVAALALRVVEDGTLGLDHSISQWLPELHHSHINPAITLRQLLNHRAGTYNFGDDIPFRQALFSDWDRTWQPEEVLDYVQAPYFPAGTDGQYSNTGYLLAGMILRQAFTTDLSTEMRCRIFEPSGMQSSFSGVEEGWTGDLAHPHLDFNGDGVHEDLGGIPRLRFCLRFGRPVM